MTEKDQMVQQHWALFFSEQMPKLFYQARQSWLRKLTVELTKIVSYMSQQKLNSNSKKNYPSVPVDLILSFSLLHLDMVLDDLAITFE